MSAIFGILDLEGRAIDPAWVSSMQDDLAHRGPDGKGLYQEESIVMGHMLLQITPESIYDRSPYEEDGFVITANARLDERETLMDRLNIAGAERDTITDPLLLLRSYIKFGKDFVKDIYGDFALAIWDKAKKELFCARDQIGVKPFLYYFQEGRFVFSTELRSIVRLPFVKTEIDYFYLRDRSIGVWDKPEKTSWKNILRLKPADHLSLNSKKIEIIKYWKPKYCRNKNLKSEDDSAALLRILLEKVIRDHTRVIGEVGVPLSGGLDSSTIACLAARHLKRQGKRLCTVSSVYKDALPDPAHPDEMEYINEVFRQEKNIEPSFIYQPNLKFLENLGSQFDLHYAPVNGFYYVDQALYQKFNSNSIRRVISGLLGDMTVSNSIINPLPTLFLQGRFKALLRLFPAVFREAGQPLSVFIKARLLVGLTPNFLLSRWYKYKGKLDDRFDIRNHPLLLSKKEQSAKQKKIDSSFKFATINPFKIKHNIWPLNRDFFKEDWDCGSAHYQMEMTYPLCDRRVVELLMQIPIEHFNAGGLKRGLLKSAMKNILPEKIRDRRTKGLYSPGYPKLFANDSSQIKPSIITANNNIDKIIDSKKFQFDLTNLSESKNDGIFTYRKWVLVQLIILTYFGRWELEGRQLKKKNEKRNKKDMEFSCDSINVTNTGHTWSYWRNRTGRK